MVNEKTMNRIDLADQSAKQSNDNVFILETRIESYDKNGYSAMWFPLKMVELDDADNVRKYMDNNSRLVMMSRDTAVKYLNMRVC